MFGNARVKISNHGSDSVERKKKIVFSNQGKKYHRTVTAVLNFSWYMQLNGLVNVLQWKKKKKKKTMLLNVAFSCEENRRMSYVIHT
jgi:hypothetical protein